MLSCLNRKLKLRSRMHLGVSFNRNRKLDLFGPGEWIDEPDQVLFNHEHVTCEVIRHSNGFLIGLCRLPKDHSWSCEPLQKIKVEVHGKKFIFKTVNEEYVGFSCDMVGDVIPSWNCKDKLIHQVLDCMEVDEERKEAVYRNLAFVSDQCRKLADQIIDASSRNEIM